MSAYVFNLFFYLKKIRILNKIRIKIYHGNGNSVIRSQNQFSLLFLQTESLSQSTKVFSKYNDFHLIGIEILQLRQFNEVMFFSIISKRKIQFISNTWRNFNLEFISRRNWPKLKLRTSVWLLAIIPNSHMGVKARRHEEALW